MRAAEPADTIRTFVADLDITGLRVSKGGRRVLAGLDLSVRDGELMTVLGPSGAGKTTLLRAVAGLDPIDGGSILLGGTAITENLAHRNVSMVFQSGVFFPGRDVERNVAFPLELRRTPQREIDERVHAEGRALRIERLMARDPHELSAGHQQLVQIARALVRAPDVFLMDEPLARLDPKLRTDMRGELRMVQRGYGATTLLVTNDPVEAMSMGDRVAVLDRGRVVQVGAGEEVYGHPASRLVAELTGELALVPVTVEADPPGYWICHDAFRLRAWAPALDDQVGAAASLGLRPEHLVVGEPADAELVLSTVEHHGPYARGRGWLGATRVSIRGSHADLRAGERILVRVAGYYLFDAVSGRTVAFSD